MTLVENLRALGYIPCVEAAAEIERLRHALWLAREDLAHLVQQLDAALADKP